MASKERSPNFPALTLQKALEYASKLHTEAKRTAVKTPIALQAMGFNSANGRSLGVLGALRAYGLIMSDGGATQISDLALRILFPKNVQDAKQAKQQAALSPKLFKSIHERNGDLSEKMLASELFHQKFTQEGAAKAAQIFHQNREFTGGQFSVDSEFDELEDDELLDDSPLIGEVIQSAAPARSQAQGNPPVSQPLYRPSPTGNMIAEISVPLAGNQLTLALVGDDPVLPEDIDDIDTLIDYLKKQLRKKVERDASRQVDPN
ncbi:MAG: hypothetical protein V4733_10535 [Verrucomicrobiota bacterium]